MSLRRGDIYPEFPESSGQSPESPGYQGFDPFLFGTTNPEPSDDRKWPELAAAVPEAGDDTGDFLLPIGHDL